jgi:hypothetical protein
VTGTPTTHCCTGTPSRTPTVRRTASGTPGTPLPWAVTLFLPEARR